MFFSFQFWAITWKAFEIISEFHRVYACCIFYVSMPYRCPKTLLSKCKKRKKKRKKNEEKTEKFRLCIFLWKIKFSLKEA